MLNLCQKRRASSIFTVSITKGAHRLEIEPSFDLETGHIHLGLCESGYDRWDSFDVVQAKKYFANCAPWAEVPVD